MPRNKNNSRNKLRSEVDPADLKKVDEAVRQGRGGKNTLKSKSNDWRWYALNEQLLVDSASYPFTYPLGNPINYGPSGLDANNWAIPGICTIDITPTPGYSMDPNSPVNICARKQYSDIRKANSGSANYDSPDLMIYYLALDSMYMMLSYFKRVYGVMMTYNPVNRYAPKAIVESMGIDFDDIANNLADYRAMLNTYIIKTSSMSIPNNMSYMAKHRWMFEGIYKDQDINKAQLYLYKPHGYFVYDLDDDSAGMLRFYKYGYTKGGAARGKLTVAKIDELLAEIIDPILYGYGAQDFNIMSGDIIKAYGRENCLTMEQIPIEYAVLPAYDEEVLDQIQNLTLCGTLNLSSDTNLPSDAVQNIVQDSTKGYLKYSPWFMNRVPFSGNPVRPATVTTIAGDNCFTADKIITFDRDVVKPEHTMVASRLTNTADKVHYLGSYYAQYLHYRTLGSEVANIAAIWRYELVDGVMQLVSMRNFDMSCTFLNIIPDISSTPVLTVVNSVKDMYDKMNQLMTELGYFHRHFPVAVTAGIVDEATGDWYFDSFNGFFFDVNNYTILREQDLIQMSTAALMSEFDVTQK